MKRKKNLYINEAVWEKAKWLSKCDNLDLNDCLCKVVQNWVDQRMNKLKIENVEMFNAIEITASEKEDAVKKLKVKESNTKKLTDLFKETKFKEVLKNNNT